MKINTVIFDLDGTLLDTAPDLAAALNGVLIAHGHATLPFPLIRPHAANGSRGLIKLGFGLDETATEYPALRQEFLALYEQYCLQQTRLFPGMELLLTQLTEQKFKLAIATNKPSQFTLPILQHLQLTSLFTSIICCDQVSKAKPDPAPLVTVCHQLDVDSAQCVYIGDTEIDVIAAKRAAMAALIVSYGYQHDNENIYRWSADAIVNQPAQIREWVNKKNQVY